LNIIIFIQYFELNIYISYIIVNENSVFGVLPNFLLNRLNFD